MTADLYDPLHDRLEQILSALPGIIESRRDTVKAQASFLCSTFRSPPDDVSPAITKKDAPDLLALTKQDERDLLALRNRSRALRRHISKMSENARVAMGSIGVSGNDLGKLVLMEEAAQVALKWLRAVRPAGRPPHKRHVQRITMDASSAFLWLTGRHPGLRTNLEGVAYGPFLDFLKAVFEACGIAASAESQFKAFQRKFRPPNAIW